MRFFLLSFALGGVALVSGAVAQDSLPFTDTDTIPEWALPEVDMLVQKGILAGNDDGTFRPGEPINRAEFAKVIVEATRSDLYTPLGSSFTDVQPTDWFFPYVETARVQGWVDGYDDGTYRPGKKINRAEIAKILVEAFGIPIPEEEIGTQPWYNPYFGALHAEELLPYDQTRMSLDPEVEASRAEVFYQIGQTMLRRGYATPYDLTYGRRGADTIEEDESDDPEETAPQEFEFQDTTQPVTIPNRVAKGILNVSRVQQPNTLRVNRGQKDVLALELMLEPQGIDIWLTALKFRRIGTGSLGNFRQMWIEIDGRQASGKIDPTKVGNDDVITINLNGEIKLDSRTKSRMTLRVDVADDAMVNTSSRFVLYLPEWIGASSTANTGFFPFGGADMRVE